MESIRAWLNRNGCTCNPGGNTPMTHMIMSGGTLFVPEDLYDEFLGVYGREIERGRAKLAYSEKRSNPTFRMYFDIDVLDHRQMGDEQVLGIVREVQSTTALFFPGAPDDALKCVVSRTNAKEVKVETGVVPGVALPVEAPAEGVAVKNGIHLNFPKLLVNLEMALQIRFSVVRLLEQRFGPRPVAENPWSDVIDKAPYFSGLKMIGSVKRMQCNLCHSSKKRRGAKDEREEAISNIKREIARFRRKHFNRGDDLFDYSNVMTFAGDEYRSKELSEMNDKYHVLATTCMQCYNKGWYLEDRYYSPSHVLGAGGVLCCDDLEYIRRDFHEQMRWTSIRARSCDQPLSSYSVPRGHSAPSEDTSAACLTAFGSAGLEFISPGFYREIIQSDIHAEDARGQGKWRGSTIKDPETMELICKCVRDVHDKYSDITVKEAVEIKTGKKTDTTSTTITSGAGAGMVIQNKSNKATGHIVKKMANTNNSSIVSSAVLQVYTSIVVRVSGSGSKFCQNKGDEHASNSVYFCISKKGVVQMCHSAKEALGSSGKPCKKYHSERKPISVALSRRLFPEEFGINMSKVDLEMKKRSGEGTIVVKKKLKKGTKAALLKWNRMCK